jgi:hypothetical protein
MILEVVANTASVAVLDTLATVVVIVSDKPPTVVVVIVSDERGSIVEMVLNTLDSQKGPVKSGRQKHVIPAIRSSTHVPPFKHGQTLAVVVSGSVKDVKVVLTEGDTMVATVLVTVLVLVMVDVDVRGY